MILSPTSAPREFAPLQICVQWAHECCCQPCPICIIDTRGLGSWLVHFLNGRRRWSKLAEWLSLEVSKRYVSE